MTGEEYQGYLAVLNKFKSTAAYDDVDTLIKLLWRADRAEGRLRVAMQDMGGLAKAAATLISHGQPKGDATADNDAWNEAASVVELIERHAGGVPQT